MSHEISFNKDGEAEVFTGSNKPAWHGLGVTVQGLLTAREALEAAKLTWEVQKQPIYIETPTTKEIPDYFATVRQDNYKVLGVVKGRYQVIQNAESFEFFDQIIGEGQAVYDTAGALFDGKRIWILAKLKNQLFIDSRPDDVMDRYVLLTKGHDGQNTLMLQAVTTRVVCANTLSAALSGAKHQFKIRHTKSYKDKVEQAQATLKMVNGYFGNLQLVINELARQKFSVKQMTNFAEKLLPDQKVGQNVVKHERARSAVVTLFHSGTGNRGETKFDGLNAVTEFVDHKRGTRMTGTSSAEEKRFNSSFFGSGAMLKQRALNLLTKN